MPWNTIKNEDDRPLLEYQLEKVVRGFFDPELFLDYMRYFVLFEDDGDSLIKKIAGYHQFHGVRDAVRVTAIAAADSDDNAVRERLAPTNRRLAPCRSQKMKCNPARERRACSGTRRAAARAFACAAMRASCCVDF